MKTREISQLELKIISVLGTLRNFKWNIDARYNENEIKKTYHSLQKRYKELTGKYFNSGSSRGKYERTK